MGVIGAAKMGAVRQTVIVAIKSEARRLFIVTGMIATSIS
jgi:hypothetical protein